MAIDRGALLLALTLAGAIACTSPTYETYRKENPDWDPEEFPSPGASLAELLAGLSAPRSSPASYAWRGNTGSVHATRVFDVSRAGWREVPIEEASKASPDAAAAYLVVARLGCTNADLGVGYRNSAETWYLFERDALRSWLDVRFGPRCSGRVTHRTGGLSPEYVACLTGFAKRVLVRRTDLEDHGCGVPR